MFHLDDDDDADAVYAMLKHMYGITFNQHPDNFGAPRLQFLWKAYVVADKYDCPSMRLAITTRTRKYLGNHISLDQYLASVRCTCYEELVQAISKICGPDALQLACPGMRDAVFDWLCRNFDLCIQEEGFNMAVKDGTLLDAQLTTRLLLKIGKEVGDRGRRRDLLSRGSSVARSESPLGEFFGLAG